ncbi:FadR/GntR family transcriptional regulator [Egicoccus sp. AB-alg6-2]|uniref:FadR/GntR family transcriptional regulator n=1 Tax=Egicoccus sp. AB-alg6-2 TaxID=3242692 RepID=UPI00359E835F
MSVSSFLTPVTGGRMSGQIVNQISDLIRKGQLRPGDRLPAERELVSTFGVSRVTVRDALRVLEVMGLVEIRVGSAGGAFVTTPTPDVIGETLSNMLVMRSFEPEQIAEVRLVIELGIFALVVERITDEDIADLRQMCVESKRKLRTGGYDTQLSMAFHSRLAEAAHNPAISMLSESFSGPLAMGAMRSKEVRRNAHKKTVEEHTEIVDALEAGDADRARLTLIAHLLRGRTAADGTERLLGRAVQANR